MNNQLTAEVEKAPKTKTDRDGLSKCRVCGCTERKACDPPCGWEPSERNLCSSCADALLALWKWRDAAHRPSIAALMRELKSLSIFHQPRFVWQEGHRSAKRPRNYREAKNHAAGGAQ